MFTLKRLLISFSFLLLIFSCANSNADKKPEVRIFIASPGYQALPYYNWSELALEPNGPEPDLIREILELKGYSYYFVADYLYKGIGDPRIESLTDNAADISIRAISITKERSQLVDFSNAYFVDGLAAIVHKDSSIKTIGDLDGKRIYVYSYTLAYNWAKQNLPNAIIITELDVNVNPWTLQYQNLADAYINDKITLLNIASSYPNFRILKSQFTQDSLGIAIKKGDKHLVKNINDALKELRANGRLDTILSAYYK